MTPAPATLNFTFNATDVGTYRVCYRIGNTGSYSCIETSCVSVGPCTAQIPITVDEDTCSAVQYTGYIQATCEAPDSLTGRVAWEITFTPSPNCKSYTVTCSRLGIASVTMTHGGASYVTPPMVSFTGGGGVATATAVLGDGGILALTSSIVGSGYADGIWTNVGITGGSGSGARGTVTISGGLVTEPIVITTPGTGYLAGDSVGIESADVGGPPAVGGEWTVTSDAGQVVAVTSIVTTTKFTSVPGIVFTGGAGDGAAGTVVMDPCPAITADGCSGSPVVIAAGVLPTFGSTVVVCDHSTPAVAAEYDVVQSGNCLCSCTLATISIDPAATLGQTVRYTYNKCGLEVRTGILTKGGSPESISDCVVPGSIVFQELIEGVGGTIAYGDPC